MAKGFDARGALVDAQRRRNLDRSAVGLWIASLDAEGRDRFAEYVAAYHELRPEVSSPSFAEAIKADPILGALWPKISTDALKNWLSRRVLDEEPQG